MKAVVLKGFGDVDQVEVQDVPEPKPGKGEVKVRVRATSINPIDMKVRHGYRSVSLPHILGRDVAGEVVKLGPGVTSLRVGERVLGFVPGAFAEFVVAKVEHLARVPEALPLEDAAALPLVATTGAQLIEENAKPEKGDTVLVTGAVGGVGRTAVFVAKQRGARVLAGVHASQKEEAGKLGVDGVYAIDDDADIARIPMVDEIADTVDGATIAKLLPHLRPGGRLGSVLGEPDEARKRDIEVHAFMAHPDGPRLQELAEAAARCELQIPIAERLPLAEVREAMRHVEAGTHGKVLLTM